MKDLVIIGAGGFGREVAWLVEEINHRGPVWNLLGFIDEDDGLCLPSGSNLTEGEQERVITVVKRWLSDC